MPSGESMKTAEAPLLAKVTDRQECWGNTWADVMKLALEIDGLGEWDPETLWLDTTPRDEANQVSIASQKVDLGVSRHQALRELGYSDKQIDQFAVERTDEARRAQKLATRLGLDDPGQPDNTGNQPGQKPPKGPMNPRVN
jgi:hypothetical protein